MAACGLGVSGLGPDLRAADTAGNEDGAAIAPDSDGGLSQDSSTPVDGGAPDDALPEMGASATDGGDGDVLPLAVVDGASCRSLIPSGWNLVIYDVGGSTCPSGFGAHSVAGTPVVGADACACTCAVTQTGSCSEGTLSAFESRGNGNMGNMCAQQWFSVTIAGSACTPVQTPSGQPPRTFQASPLIGQGGTCSDTLAPDATMVSTAAALYCDVPASRADSVCDGSAPPGFATCIATTGMTPCPPGTPFTQRHVVEDSVALQCSACSGCGVATTCANAVLTTYTDSVCGSQGTPLTVDGTCTTIGGQGFFSVAGVTYAATASSTCTHGTSTPVAQLTNPQTMCCR